MKHYTELKKADYKPNLQKTDRKKPLCEDIFTFDIETTSVFIKSGKAQAFDMSKDSEYYKDTEKAGFCYIWMFSINDVVYYGRYLNEFVDFMNILHNMMKSRTMVIWVHNLAFEFQFIRELFTIDKVFAREEKKPLKFEVPNLGIEFRCSYALTNMSLDACAKSYKLPVQKLVGDLDYNQLRTPETVLTAQELAYCEHDCLVLYHLIKMKLKEYSLKDIPMTQTGYVRKDFKDSVKDARHGNSYALLDWKQKMATMSPSPEVFSLLVKSYAGGYTHANAYYTGQVLNDVNSYDFTSSYPSVIIQEKYPCSIFSDDDFTKLNTDRKAYILTIKYNNINSIKCNTYISHSKCDDIHGFVLDNGRVSSARTLTITMTEQDYITIENNYEYESREVLMCKSSIKKRLPKAVVNLTAKLFDDKNEIKKLIKAATTEEEKTNQEVLYTEVKQRLNSIYGMMVTNYITDEVEYNSDADAWVKHELTGEDVKDRLQEQADKKKLMLPYQWGVWVSAYARRNLWSVIELVDRQVVYCDTDSIKCVGDITEPVSRYNEKVRTKNDRAAQVYGIQREKLGSLGEFDHDGEYKEFTTLGAKKYAYTAQDDSLHITISGVNKRTGVKALKGDIRNFKTKLQFDYEASGKKTLYYTDDQPALIVKDCNGKTGTLQGKHGICLQPTTYNLGMSPDYLSFIGAKVLKNIP